MHYLFFIVVLSRHKVIISFMLSILECNTCSSCLSLEDIKWIAIVKWIFRVWYFLLRSFMIYFKYGLILFNWFNWFHSIDSVLFLSPIFHILWNCQNRIYLLFLVYSNLLLPFLVQILSITDYFAFYYLNYFLTLTHIIDMRLFTIIIACYICFYRLTILSYILRKKINQVFEKIIIPRKKVSKILCLK